MRGSLKGIDHEKIKYYTSLNSRKGPTSLEEAFNPAVWSIGESDNSGSECNNEIVIEIDESNDGSIKPSSPSGMGALMQMLFIFGVEYIY